MKEKSVSAYMTLEVSLLFPIIITVLICVLYIFFFTYNQTIAFQNGAISALYGQGFSYMEMDNTILTEKTFDVLEDLNEKQYLALDSLRQKVEIEKDSIKVSQNGKIVMPLINENIFGELAFEEIVSLNLQNSTFYIRQIRKVKTYEDGNYQ